MEVAETEVPASGLSVLNIDSQSENAERLQLASDRLLASAGAGHRVHDLPIRADGRRVGPASHPWRLDPVPLLLNGSTFDWLAAALEERADALDAVLADVYGARRLLREGVFPPRRWRTPPTGWRRSDPIPNDG